MERSTTSLEAGVGYDELRLDSGPQAASEGAASEPEFYAGLGFTSGPSTFLLSGGADFATSESWTVGPLVQIGVSDDQTLFAPSANIKRFFEVADKPRLRPFVQAGLGLAYVDKDRGAGDDDGVGPLFNLGGGLRFDLGPRTSIGSSLLFNVLPVDVAGEHFYLSWELVQFAFRF